LKFLKKKKFFIKKKEINKFFLNKKEDQKKKRIKMVRALLPTTPYSLELILICIEKPLVLVGISLFISMILNLYFCMGIIGFILLVLPLGIFILVGIPIGLLVGFSYLDERKFGTKDWSEFINDKNGLLESYKG
jgi:hypothetical protein